MSELFNPQWYTRSESDARYLKLTGSLADVSNHSHTVLSDIGTNTHAQIDTAVSNSVSHIASTSNPHSVTLAQVGGTTDHTALSNIGTLSHATIDSYLDQAVKTTSSPAFAGLTVDGAIENGLVARWNMNEGTGTTIADSSNNSNTGTLGAGTAGYMPSWVAGENGYVLNFDGVDDYVNVPNSASIELLHNPLTFSVWVYRRTNSQDWEGVVVKGKQTDPWDGYSLFSMAVGYFRARVGNYTTDIQTYHIPSNNAWHQIVVRNDGTNFAIYVDGVIDSGEGTTGTISATGQALWLGRAISAGEDFDGMIGKIGIYDRALSDREIAELYHKESQARMTSSQGCVLALNCNSETVTGSAGSETVLDSSTYNNHAANSGATHSATGGFNGSGGFSFDGSNDYITVPNSTSLGIAEDMTLEFWMLHGAGGEDYQHLFNKQYDDVGGTQGYRVFTTVNSNDIYFGRAVNGSWSSNAISVPIGSWHHVVWTVKAGVSNLYRDGQLISGLLTDKQTIGTATDLQIAADSSLSWNFIGSLDEVHVYNRALTAEEIKSHYFQQTEAHNSFVSQKDVYVDSNGNVGIGTITPTSVFHVVGLPVYANNAAAVAGGLTAGAFYRTNGDPDPVCVVH
uniref:Putative lectin/glucanase superfamily protein n=1 Tax=viral metagenome TaxID=1070528 RepID=A0A6M3K811_9ZZZZ